MTDIILAWMVLAIVLAGWWISTAIEEFTEAYREARNITGPMDKEYKG